MGIISIYRNLLSKFKPKSLSSSSSSDLHSFRRIFSPAADPATDLKRQSMFLIEHVYNGITNYSELSTAAAANNSSWKDHHRRICSPFSGRPGKYCLVGGCKEWTLFWPEEIDVDEDSNLFGVDYEGNSFHQPQRRLSLWNPKTNRIKTLPLSRLPRPRPVLSIDIGSFGFGFDPKSQDYKLVCFLEYLFTDLSDSSPDVNIEVYSLKTDSWKQITPSHYLTGTLCPHHSVHINGVYYWANDSIVSFDFADEKFSDISLPRAPSFLEGMRSTYCVAEFHESLAVIVPYWVPIEDLTEEEKQKQLQQPFSIKIWVWNGQKWNVGPRVAVGDFPVGDEIASVLCLFQNDYLFLQGFKEAELMLFNCKTGKLENLGIHHDPPEKQHQESRVLVSSLILRNQKAEYFSIYSSDLNMSTRQASFLFEEC